MRFSVIVPCYNAQSTLARCLDSLFAQGVAREEYEVIVVDDGSTDQSLQIVSGYTCQLLGNPRNMGPGVARNLGAARAQGEILVFIDSDCIAPPDWLAGIGRHFAGDLVQAVWGGYCGSAGDSVVERFAFLECLYRQTALEFHLELSSTSNFACRKSAFARIGGFPQYALWWNDPQEKPFWGNEDMDVAYLLYRIFPQGMVWDRENGVVHHFRPSGWKYCRQQAFFASASVVSYAVFPDLRKAGNAAGRHSVLAQLLSTVPLGLLLLAGQWPVLLAGPLLSLLAVPLLNRQFLKLAQKHEGRFFYLLLFAAYLLARNLAWAAGCLRGMVWGIGGLVGRMSKRITLMESSSLR